MAQCAPFEDYEYIIFGNDRCFIVGTEFFLLLVWVPTLYKMRSSCLKLYLAAITIPMLPLVPIRVVKTVHTVVDPSNVEDSWIYCWYLRIEYAMHYWLSYNFLSFTIAYFWLVLKRKSTVFPMENIHRKLSVVLLAESLIRSVLTEFFDSILWYWPTTMHAWLQSLLTMTWIAFLFFLPCRACMKQPKEGRGGWSFAWFFLYMVIPFLLNFYQAMFQAVILLPRHSVTGYEASDGEQDTYWFSIESYVSHKFSLTIMGSLISMMFLPPVQEVFCKRRDPSEVYSFSEMH